MGERHVPAYVDILNFFTPGVVEEILDGKVFVFDMNQMFSTTALVLMSIPSVMVVLSIALPANLWRTTNLVVAAIFVPVTVFNIVGESWMLFYGLGIALETAILVFIIRCAWIWPRTQQPATASH